MIMKNMPLSIKNVTHWDKSCLKQSEQDIIVERPLVVQINGQPYAVIMRTPGDEEAHIVGFCLVEGLIDHRDDFKSISIITNEVSEIAEVTIQPHRDTIVQGILAQKEYIHQTSSAIIPKKMVHHPHLKSNLSNHQIEIQSVIDCINHLSHNQPIRQKTFASHAVAIYSQHVQLLSVKEDAGRHNAFDKAIGQIVLNGVLKDACFCILSSRVSYDLMIKASRSGIAHVFSISRPTSLAIEMAAKLNITLACLSKDGGLFVYSGQNHLTIHSN